MVSGIATIVLSMIHKNIALLCILLALLGAILTSTNPEDVSAGLFMVVYGIMFASVSAFLVLLMQVIRKSSVIKWNLRKMIRVSMLVALFPVFLLLLHSIGQLTFRDIALALSLSLLLYAYFNRFSFKPHKQ